MAHKIISAIGLGVLGIDPITAVYLLSMGLRGEKKTKITLFFLSFAGFTIVIGAALSSIFGVTAIELIKNIMPDDNSPFWAVLNFAISICIFIWIIKKLFAAKNKEDKKDRKDRKAINGSNLKYLTTGFVFALTCFTDPTYYAVFLLGGQTRNFFTATILITLWFLVSQFMAIIVYVANELNLLDKLNKFTERIKQKNLKPITYIIYGILLLVAVALLADAGYYLFAGEYIF